MRKETRALDAGRPPTPRNRRRLVGESPQLPTTFGSIAPAGALLALALSFDEVIVTTFTEGAQNTLSLWIFGAILRGQQLPEVNAVVVFVLILTAVPIAYAARISSGERSFGSTGSK